MTTKSLAELRDDIEMQVLNPRRPSMRGRYNGLIGPYSHNIIGIVLRMIDADYGRAEANKAARELGLTRLGWSEMPEETT